QLDHRLAVALGDDDAGPRQPLVSAAEQAPPVLADEIGPGAEAVEVAEQAAVHAPSLPIPQAPGASGQAGDTVAAMEIERLDVSEEEREQARNIVTMVEQVMATMPSITAVGPAETRRQRAGGNSVLPVPEKLD